MAEKDKKVMCPICGGPMRLEMYESTSYFQCKNPVHRMTLPEYSDLAHNKRSKDEIGQSMKKRSLVLDRQRQIQ